MKSSALSQTARLLRDLVALPSVNPAFLRNADAYTGEHRVAAYLRDRASKSGMETRFQRVTKDRANLMVSLKPLGRTTRRILLAPHLDTVGGDVTRIFDPRVRGDLLHGRGSCDTKGSVAAMFSAIELMAKNGSRPRHTEIVFMGLVDEENCQLGSRKVASTKLRADLAIVGEPTQLKVVSAHKGSFWLSITTTGRAAHGAMPHLGQNAISRMAPIIECVTDQYAEHLKHRSHPLLGTATASIGTIRGGVQPNIVADECAIEVDRRSLPGETEDSVQRELRRFLKQQRLTGSVHSTKGVPCNALETDPRLPMVQRFMRSVGRRRTEGVHYYCDAAVLSAGGIPSVVFGPGNIGQAHTADEWISLRSLDRGAALLGRFLRDLP